MEKRQLIDMERDYRKMIWVSIILIAAFKCVLMALFSSDYQDQMFIPFVRCFLVQRENPYEYYYLNNLPRSFPYPPLMLWIVSISGIFQSQSIAAQNFLFKLPIFLFDLLGLYFLQKISKERFKYALVLYFLSPIHLYSGFMHGQLDIIPTTLLLASIYFLLKNRSRRNLVCFSLLLAAALGTKLHILVAVPLLYFYLFRKRGLKECFYSMGIVILVLGAIIVPFWGEGFIKTVLLNEEQSVIMQVYLNYGVTKVILPVLVVAMIYLKIYQISHISRQLLLNVIGILFSIFLVCVSPMPGWFAWIVPFVVLYFKSVSENKYKMLAIYFLFNLMYLFYFIFCHQRQAVDLYLLGYSLQGIKIQSGTISNGSFTAMVACLIMLVIEMYRTGVASNSLYRRGSLPFSIGIAGDSGTGKSELLRLLDSLLGGNRTIQNIEGDGDHRWERGDTAWDVYTHLDPKANYLYRQAQDIMTLREGSIVRRTDYDHTTGTFTAVKRIIPKRFIVLCGLHSLYLPQTRKALDLKLYMDTDETLRRFWKIQRDRAQRNHTNEEVLRQIEARIPDAKRFIYPQKQFADLCIRYFDPELKDCCVEDYSVQLSLELLSDISVNLEPVIMELEACGVQPQHQYCDDMKHQRTIFYAETVNNHTINFQEIALHCIPQFDELFCEDIHWKEGIEGVLQLFILIMIYEKMKGAA